MTELQLEFIREKYKWNSENLLLINFVHASERCFYNNNLNLENKSLVWKEFYSKVDLYGVLNIYVYSDSIAAKYIINNHTVFQDFDNFLLNQFFNSKKECYGVLIVNSAGKYEMKEGEYAPSEIENFIKKLKK